MILISLITPHAVPFPKLLAFYGAIDVILRGAPHGLKFPMGPVVYIEALDL